MIISAIVGASVVAFKKQRDRKKALRKQSFEAVSVKDSDSSIPTRNSSSIQDITSLEEGNGLWSGASPPSHQIIQ